MLAPEERTEIEAELPALSEQESRLHRCHEDRAEAPRLGVG